MDTGVAPRPWKAQDPFDGQLGLGAPLRCPLWSPQLELSSRSVPCPMHPPRPRVEGATSGHGCGQQDTNAGGARV